MNINNKKHNKLILNKSFYNKAKSNILAFTLVELIVVITILAILGTIAFISLQGFSSSARDSRRVSDIQNIKKSLELFSINTGKYPLSDDYFTVSYSGEDLRYQGIVGNGVTTNLSRNLNKKPTDPLTETEYIYSVINNQTQYEVLSIYESDVVSLGGTGTPGRVPVPRETYADTQDYPKIEGTYNGVYVKSTSYYVPTPSIINAEVSGTGLVLDDTNINSQIVTGLDNLPSISTGGLDINLSPYDGGTITENSTNEEKVALVNTIKGAYTGSILASETLYSYILSATSTGEIVTLIDNVVLNKISVGALADSGDNNSGVCTFGTSTFGNCTFE